MKTPKLELTRRVHVLREGMKGVANYIPTINGRKLQEEGGVTHISLENLEVATKRLGKVTGIVLVEEGAVIHMERGALLATGFATGYRGEGPTGLAKVIFTHTDLAKTMEEAQNLVANWTSVCRGVIWGDKDAPTCDACGLPADAKGGCEECLGDSF